MERDWEIFAEPPRIRKDKTQMMLNGRYELVINRHAHDAVGQPEAVFLLYSERTDSIAITKADPRLDNAFPVRRKHPNNFYSIHIKSFCDRHEIRYDGSVRFMDITVEDDKLVANLLKTHQIPKRKRPEGAKRK